MICLLAARIQMFDTDIHKSNIGISIYAIVSSKWKLSNLKKWTFDMHPAYGKSSSNNLRTMKLLPNL